MEKTLLLFVSCLLLAKVVFAQQNFIHYSVKDGLPQMQCLDIMQDSKGYLWITTKGGISRFDGINFKNFTTNEGLPENFVENILEDSKGNIYALTSKGVCKIQNDTVILFPNFAYPKGFISRNHSVVDAHDNLYWFIKTGPNLWALVKFKNETYTTIAEFSIVFIPNHCSLYLWKPQNQVILNIWKTDNINIIYTIENNKLTDDFYSEINAINKINVEKRQYVLITAQQERFLKHTTPESDSTALYHFNNPDSAILSFHSNFHKIQYLPEHQKWYYVTGNYLFWQYQNNKQTVVNQEPVSNFLIDTENNLWLVGEKGLYKKTPFYNYNKQSGMLDYVWTIVEDNNQRLWFSSFTNYSLYFMDNDTIKKGPKFSTKQKFYLGAIKKQNGDVLFPVSNGFIHFNGNKFRPHNLVGETLTIFEDTFSQTTYFGNTAGLYIAQPLADTIHKPEFAHPHRGHIMDMAQNANGHIWYITKNELGTINLPNNIVISTDSVPFIRAVDLFFDDNNNLWLAAENGLFMFDGKTFYRLKHAELQTLLMSVAKMDSNHIVYGGLRGIGILNLKAFYKHLSSAVQTIETHRNQKNTIEINAEPFVNYYDASQGFLGEEVAQKAIFKDSKGRLWVPTNSNVVMFSPNELTSNSKAPFTHISGVSISNNNIHWRNLTDSMAEINHTFANVRFHFIGISHTAPQLVKYKYRLKGFNNTWSNPTKQRSVSFTNLSPGNYTFELLAANGNGVWNTRAVAKSFRIAPAWYQTLAAKILIPVFVLSLMFWLGTLIMRRRQKQKELNSTLTDLQYNSLLGQLYPHFLFNAITNIGGAIYTEKADEAYNYTAKLTKLIRIVHKSRQKLSRTIAEEMEFVQNYLDVQKYRFRTRFDYSIEIAADVDQKIEIPQMLIQTFVENAIKHGLEAKEKGGMLQICAFRESEKNVFVIQDNGIGLQAAKKRGSTGTGTGLKTIREITNLYNKTRNVHITFQLIDLYERNQTGTRAEIEIR